MNSRLPIKKGSSIPTATPAMHTALPMTRPAREQAVFAYAIRWYFNQHHPGSGMLTQRQARKPEQRVGRQEDNRGNRERSTHDEADLPSSEVSLRGAEQAVSQVSSALCTHWVIHTHLDPVQCRLNDMIDEEGYKQPDGHPKRRQEQHPQRQAGDALTCCFRRKQKLAQTRPSGWVWWHERFIDTCCLVCAGFRC